MVLTYAIGLQGKAFKASLALSLPTVPSPSPPLAESNHEVSGDRRKQNLLNQMPLGNGTLSYRVSLAALQADANATALMLLFGSSFQNNRTASPRSILVSSFLSLFVREDCGDGRKACSAKRMVGLGIAAALPGLSGL